MNTLIENIAVQANNKTGYKFNLNHQSFHGFLTKFSELLVKQCGYYADIFECAGCPVDMDVTETKPSDFIKKHFGVEQ